MNAWLRALRLPFLSASVAPVLLGVSLAFWQGHPVRWPAFLMAGAAMCLLHLGANLANDYYDHASGSDDLNPRPTPFSGGSRVIQEGLIGARRILLASIALFLLGCGAGLFVNHLSEGNTVLFIGVIGVLLGFFYSAPPLRMGYRGFGEVGVALAFGPLPVLGSYYAQTGRLAWSPILAAAPITILIFLVLFVNEFPDYVPDKDSGKTTIVVLLGRKRATYWYRNLLVVCYLSVVLLVVVKIYPSASMLALLTVPVAAGAYATLRMHYNDTERLLPANARTIALHAAAGVVVPGSLVLDALVG